MKSQLIAIVAAVLVVGCTTTQQPSPPAEAKPVELVKPKISTDFVSIDQLAWLTGNWEGPRKNGGTLEETWLPPRGNTVTAIVRFIQENRTDFVEIINIEKKDDSLELRLRMFTPTLEPARNKSKPMVLKLSKIEPSRVEFEGVSDGALRKLCYEKVSSDLFTIEIENFKGKQTKYNLSPARRDTN